MQVGDLVKHTMLKETRQVGIITARNRLHNQEQWKYKVLWAGIHTEEYWFTNKEVEAICK